MSECVSKQRLPETSPHTHLLSGSVESSSHIKTRQTYRLFLSQMKGVSTFLKSLCPQAEITKAD